MSCPGPIAGEAARHARHDRDHRLRRGLAFIEVEIGEASRPLVDRLLKIETVHVRRGRL